MQQKHVISHPDQVGNVQSHQNQTTPKNAVL